MKKIDSSQLISILANIGVIAGLILVALELRQTTDAVAGATYQARSEMGMLWNLTVSGTPEFVDDAMSVRVEAFEDLTREQQYRVQGVHTAAYYRMDGYLLQSELGLLPDDSYDYQFNAEMEAWVPRWINSGLLTSDTVAVGTFMQRHMRPAFAREVLKYIDDSERDEWRWLVERSME